MKHSETFPPVIRTKLTWPRHLRILIVDDEIETAELLRAVFQFEEHVGIMAHTDAEAINAVANERFDAVYIDIKHLRMNWCGLVKELRRLPHLAQIPFVAISAIDKYAEPGLDLNEFDYFLLKPAGLQQIFQPLRDIVADKSASARSMSTFTD